MIFFRTTDTTDTTDTRIWKPGLKLYLSYEFFSYDRHDRYNDMETRLKERERTSNTSYTFMKKKNRVVQTKPFRLLFRLFSINGALKIREKHSPSVNN